MKALDFVKKHPVAVGVGVFAIGLVLVLMLSGGDKAVQPTVYAGSGVDPSTVAANTALTQSQLAAGVANQQTSAQLTQNLAAIASQDKAYQLQNNTDMAALTLQSSVQLASIAAQKDTQQMVSSLSASVSQAQIAAQTSMNANNNTTQTQIAKLSADMQLGQQAFLAAMQNSNNQRDIKLNDSNNSTQAQLASIYSTTSIAQMNATRDMFNKQADTQANIAGVQAGAYLQSQSIAAVVAQNNTNQAAAVQGMSINAQNNKDLAQIAASKELATQDRLLDEKYDHALLYQRAYANQFSIIAQQGSIPF